MLNAKGFQPHMATLEDDRTERHRESVGEIASRSVKPAQAIESGQR